MSRWWTGSSESLDRRSTARSIAASQSGQADPRQGTQDLAQMKQIARRLDLQPAVDPRLYAQRWIQFQKVAAARAKRIARTPKTKDYHWQDKPDPLRPMSVPRYGWKLALWIQQNGRCQYCCASLLPRYHVDHIHPRAKGGKNHLSNYCLACQPCNLSKHDHSAMDFVLTLLSVVSP